MNAPSTLVETVSINYEDFNESFLTCSTCLCTYDGQEHTPKLLSCSHSVCRSCLERIAEGVGVRDAGSFRCPICRETIPLPRGGVGALPPSFLVNQLLDLMSRQRREVVPKCSSHQNQELMFCESCDSVFCTVCMGGEHQSGTGDHTIIPFSTAIKRMSEILLYKAELCVEKLGNAADNVEKEIAKLEETSSEVIRKIDESFQELFAMVQRRKEEMLEEAEKMCLAKKSILQEQLSIIGTEKEKVNQQCAGLQYQVEIRHISAKISELNEKMYSLGSLLDPRENAFLKMDFKHGSVMKALQEEIGNFGELKTSKTLPSLCFADVRDASVHLSSTAVLQTVDYHGAWQVFGGDPVTAQLLDSHGAALPVKVEDLENGTYEIHFTPLSSGPHQLHILIFERPIKGSPCCIEVSEHINSISRFGSRGCRDRQLMQPVCVTSSLIDGEIFVLISDTGNSRLAVLTLDLELVKYIEGPGLEERGGTGIAITSHDTILVINWRFKTLTQIDFDGELISQFTHPALVEPIDVAINSQGHVLVADNGARAIFIFELSGKLLKTLRQMHPQDPQLQLTSICCGPNDEVIVGGRLVRILSGTGELLREVGFSETRGKGLFGGVCCDSKGNLLVTHSGKSKCCVFVYSYSTGKLRFVIDSDQERLKRPNGLRTIPESPYLIVVDLGNDCVKKFIYQ